MSHAKGRFVFYLTLSLALHMVMVGGVYRFAATADGLKDFQSPVEVALTEARPRISKAKLTGKLKSQPSKAEHLAKALMSGLSSSDFSPDPERRISAKSAENSFEGMEALGAGSSALANEFGEKTSIYQEIFQRIDSRLIYQTLLAQYNHHGWVSIHVKVDEEGKLLPQSLQGTGSDGVLKVHSSRAIRSGLSTALKTASRSVMAAENPLLLRFYYGKTGQESYCKAGTQGSILTFCRFGSEKAVSKNLKDHILSGGVRLNMFETAELWQQYKSARLRAAGDLDPFQNYRNDPDYE